MEQSNAAEVNLVNAKEDIMDNADTSSIAIEHTLGSDSGANADTVIIDADDANTSIHVVHDDSDVVFVAESPLSDINPTENGQEIKPADAPAQVMESNENKEIVDDIDEFFQSPNATESDTATEKSDCVVLEPMDIDEILDSVNTDQEIATSSEDISDVQFQDEAVEQSQAKDRDELPNVEGEMNVSEKSVQSPRNVQIEVMEQEAEKRGAEVNDLNNLPIETSVAIAEEKIDIEMAANESVNHDEINKVTDISSADVNQPEETSVIDKAEIETNDKKNADNPISESVNVFDLLLENEDLFGTVDVNSDAQQKSDEIPIQTVTDAFEIDDIPEISEKTENVGNDQNIDLRNAEMVEETNNITAVENNEAFESIVNNEAVESMQNNEAVEHTETAKSSEAVEPVEPLEAVEPSEIFGNGDESLICTENVANIPNVSENIMVDEEPMQIEENEILRKVCLNVDCLKKSDIFFEAPEFLINHFHLKKRQKELFVCEYCYNVVIESYGELCGALEDIQPLFSKKIKYTDLVEIIDSSDDEDDTNDIVHDNRQTFDTNTLALIENELESVIAETLEKVNIATQMDWNRQILTQKIDNNEVDCVNLMNDMNELQKKFDVVFKNTYNIRHTFIEEVQSLDLQTLKPTQICNETYPPSEELIHPDIEYNTMYYTFRNKQISRWLPCKVVTKIKAVSGETEYTVQFCKQKVHLTNIKTIPRKYLAYGKCPDVRLNIGVRVIALYDSSRDLTSNRVNGVLRNNFYPGVIAEPLTMYTKWRYLVFFDDGYVQYVSHENIRVVCEWTDNVWESIEEPGARLFIEGYVRDLKKKRAIVQVRCGQRIQAEYSGKWYNAIVRDVDASLVQVYFEEHRRYEWIYRGSTRLLHLYQRINNVMSTPTRNDPVIEYIEIFDEKEPERSLDPPKEELPKPKTPPPRPSTPPKNTRTFASQAVRDTPQQKHQKAKKSTTPQPKPAVQHMNNSTIYVDEDKPKGKVVYYTAKKHIDVKKYVNHECQPSCLVVVQHNLASYSPLSKPLLSGFERQICKTKYNKNKYVVYRAPCGRRLRDMHEMHKYLRITHCKLNVENFTFDPLIHCLAEYVMESFVMKKPDLSGGIEKMPVQLVNCYDNTMPPPCIYSAKRIPTEGVNLNLDSEFLCGCDCIDDCLDKTKCACWKLTLAGAKYGNPETPIQDVGYEYKRLNEPVPTGIYECNSRCKCKSNCLNRVVQHPLQLKLQVFKTVNRGWGMRCLNDVPKGSFICCYAGNLLTEQSANDAGEDLGDEYFAELDYIEVVENMKEGYEPDVVHEEDNESSSADDDFDVEMESMHNRNDDSDDEFVAKSYTASEDSESRRYRTRNSVDTRKKPDKPPVQETIKLKERNSSSDEEGDEVRQVRNFMASNTMPLNTDPDEERGKSIRSFFGKDEAVYIMDAKKAGNIGRYFNHSCGPNLFVQNVFVDTHDLRFPWVAFFASTHIRAGTELTWNYNYEVGSVPGKVLICQCGDPKCRGRIL